jgi:hypothetical protein
VEDEPIPIRLPDESACGCCLLPAHETSGWRSCRTDGRRDDCELRQQVNRPGWAASPVPLIWCTPPATVPVACNVPRNGYSEPPMAAVEDTPPQVRDGDVGALRRASAQAA